MVSVIAAAGTDIRAQPDVMARVIAHAAGDEELPVLAETVTGSDGRSLWVAIAYGDSIGYVPREDVSAPYLPSSSDVRVTALGQMHR